MQEQQQGANCVGDMTSKAVAQGLEFHHIIDGQRCKSLSGEQLPVLSPSDGRQFCTIEAGNGDDIELAVAAARRAIDHGPWGRMAAVDRGRILLRLAELISANSDELSALESRDTGKPLKQGVADIAGCVRYFEYYGGAADKIHGDTIPIPGEFLALTLRQPHGVVAGIIPWNYPAQILGRVAGAGLAMGNAMVIKPAEDACLSVLRVAELALEAGLPAGAFNVVSGTGLAAGVPLSAHGQVDFITFTGSPATGTAIQQAAAISNRGTTMELGGKSPQVIFADADLEKALPVVVNAIIQNGGQTCSAGSRVLIEASIYNEFTSELALRFAALEAGPHDGDFDLGALISQKQHKIVTGFIDEAEQAGIELLARGKIVGNAPDGGYYCAPVLFGNVPAKAEIAQREVFGPVLAAFSFEDEKQALQLANDSEYGLVAAVWTRDGARQMRMAKRLHAGQVYVNTFGAGGGIELPFGGFKKSGHGREKGFDGLLHMSTTKTVVFNHG